MIVPATDDDFLALLAARGPRGLGLPDSAIAPAGVLDMLRDLAAVVATVFAPAAWLVVEQGEVVGLCSITRPPHQGELHIGYGIAPTRAGRGAATRAVADLVAWAGTDARVARLTADTVVDNLASQRVLERNGFLRSGERVDPEDGPLVCWERPLPRA